MVLRPAAAFLRRAATRERALLMLHIGHPVGVLSAANTNTEALAHCSTCNLFLHSHESCLHMPAVGSMPFHGGENNNG
jgi:hypothetical protein